MKPGNVSYRNSLSIYIARLFLAGMLLFAIQPTLVELDCFSAPDDISQVEKNENPMPEKGDLEKEYSESFKGFSHTHHQPVCNDSIIFNYIAEIPASLTRITMDILIPPPKITGKIA